MTKVFTVTKNTHKSSDITPTLPKDTFPDRQLT